MWFSSSLEALFALHVQNFGAVLSKLQQLCWIPISRNGYSLPSACFFPSTISTEEQFLHLTQIMDILVVKESIFQVATPVEQSQIVYVLETLGVKHLTEHDVFVKQFLPALGTTITTVIFI